MIFAPRVIRALISLKIGQPIRTAEEVHKLAELHGAKAGTPTMGGVLIVGSMTAATLLCARMGNPFIIACLIVTLALGLLGFRDDYLKVAKKPRTAFPHVKTPRPVPGRAGRRHLPVPVPGRQSPRGTSRLHILPVHSVLWPGEPAMVRLHSFRRRGGHVRLQCGEPDGRPDGLASGCSVATGITYAIIAVLCGSWLTADSLDIPFHPGAGEISVFMMALVGACLGFLWHNCYPARVFMGDTGPLALGGAFGMAAVCTAQELLFIVIGGVFVMEAASVVLQVGSYKLRHGKRIFAMAPIHHHFELKGWKETQVIARFWMISLLLAFLGLFLITTA